MPLTRLETSLCSKTATGMSRSGEIEDKIQMQIKIEIQIWLHNTDRNTDGNKMW